MELGNAELNEYYSFKFYLEQRHDTEYIIVYNDNNNNGIPGDGIWYRIILMKINP